MKTPPQRLEAACPKCGAVMVVSVASRRKRVQCPTCREVVSLAAPEPETAAEGETAGPTAEEFAHLRAKVERQAVLIEKLIARVMPAEDLPLPPPPEGALLSPGMSLRWLRRDLDEAPGAEVDEEQESVLLHNLRVMGQREVIVQSAGEDSARRLGERLSAVFRRAGWTVQEADPALAIPTTRGLVLAAGQCPPPKAASATYMALKAAGFAIDSRLDAALRPDQSVLIAGRVGRG